MLPDTLIASMRHRLALSGLPNLVAATAHCDEHRKHVRFDFFFTGTSEEVDFDKLEFDVLGQLVADIWAGIETVGFAAIFDKPSGEAASRDPSRLYPP